MNKDKQYLNDHGKVVKVTIGAISIVALIVTGPLPFFQATALIGGGDIGVDNSNKLSLSSLIQDGAPRLGSASAPVTVIEFGDFQCDKCARFAKETEPQLNQTYIQTGKVILVFNIFQFMAPTLRQLP